MRYDKISFIFVISMVYLVGIESNIAYMDQLKSRNFGPPKPPEAPHLEKNFQLVP